MENKYLNMTLEEVNTEVDRYNDICTKMFYEGMEKNLTWEEMEERREPYMNELKLATAAKSLMIPKEDIGSRPMEGLDIECKMPIEMFTKYCKMDVITSWDGTGNYADEDKVYFLNAAPWAFYNDFIRPDFKYVCWYNK